MIGLWRALPILLAVAVAGCGGSSPRRASAPSTHAGVASSPTAFAWVANPAPASWQAKRLPSGSELVYPPGWHLVHGDAGTATAVTLAASGRIVGYLNLTPRQGDEQLSSWPAFRVAHDRDEGDRSVQTLDHATGLKFAAGSGSCVKDQYTTRTGARYIEIACLVAGAHATSVIVGASPPDLWSRYAGTIERAVAGVRT